MAAIFPHHTSNMAAAPARGRPSRGDGNKLTTAEAEVIFPEATNFPMRRQNPDEYIRVFMAASIPSQTLKVALEDPKQTYPINTHIAHACTQ